MTCDVDSRGKVDRGLADEVIWEVYQDRIEIWGVVHWKHTATADDNFILLPKPSQPNLDN